MFFTSLHSAVSSVAEYCWLLFVQAVYCALLCEIQFSSKGQPQTTLTSWNSVISFGWPLEQAFYFLHLKAMSGFCQFTDTKVRLFSSRLQRKTFWKGLLWFYFLTNISLNTKSESEKRKWILQGAPASYDKLSLKVCGSMLRSTHCFSVAVLPSTGTFFLSPQSNTLFITPKIWDFKQSLFCCEGSR